MQFIILNKVILIKRGLISYEKWEKKKKKEIFSSQSSTVNKIKMIQNYEMILYDTILEYVGD